MKSRGILVLWEPCKWIPRNLSFRCILFHEKRLQMMLWHHNTRVNSHQRWRQTRFRVCFHLWCELTDTMNVTEWQVSWNSFVAICWWFFQSEANLKTLEREVAHCKEQCLEKLEAELKSNKELETRLENLESKCQKSKTQATELEEQVEYLNSTLNRHKVYINLIFWVAI